MPPHISGNWRIANSGSDAAQGRGRISEVFGPCRSPVPCVLVLPVVAVDGVASRTARISNVPERRSDTYFVLPEHDEIVAVLFTEGTRPTWGTAVPRLRWPRGGSAALAPQ